MKVKFSKAAGRRAACIALTAAMCTTAITGSIAASAQGQPSLQTTATQQLSYKNANGKINLDGIKLQNLAPGVLANGAASSGVCTAIVTLDGASLTQQTSDYKGYINTAAGVSAQRKIKEQHQSFIQQLERAKIPYCLRSEYDTVVNAVAIEVKTDYLKSIKKLEGVVTVSVSATYSRPKDVPSSGTGAQINSSNIYANGIYDSSYYVSQGYDGSGMTVAVIDSGVDYSHEVFDPEAMDKTASAYNDESKGFFTLATVERAMQSGSFKATQRTGAVASDCYINSKIPFAFDYGDNDNDVFPSYDQHGTHVAGIVGGKAESYTDKHGNTATDGDGTPLKFRGVAPEVQIIACKVFTDDLDSKDLGGAETVDILDALDDCTKLGVDVINMSLGTSGGFSSASLGLTQADEEGNLMKTVYGNVRAAGISLMVAASNEFSSGYGSAFGTNLASNPDSGTVGSPSTLSGAMSVASINGQSASYLLANATVTDGAVTGGDGVYFEESRNEDSDDYNFIDQMLGSHDPSSPDYTPNAKDVATFNYVVVPGRGLATDYTSATKRALSNKKEGEKVIAVVKRGGNTFKDKLELAKENGADAVIVYNNVSGMIKMSLGDMQDPIPSVSVSMDSGALLTKNGNRGTLTIDRTKKAGPFMNEYSSWGATPDLKLKPDVTSHGGEIISAVSGGYEEKSGTSMACPNLSGFTALLRGYLRDERTDLYAAGDDVSLTKLTNNVMMSTATVVYDKYGLPYSPRKQGAGLATLANVFSTGAYLYTKDTEDVTDPDYMCEDGRPKAELGDDGQKSGVYDLSFFVKNVCDQPLKFKLKSTAFTETLAADGKSVAEKAYILGASKEWTVGGAPAEEGGEITVPQGETKQIKLKITLSGSDKKYLDESFKNGMYVEGFAQLIAVNDEAKGESQCDLSLPFMGFYGDWKAAPILDYNCFEMAAFDKDTSLNDDTRPQPCVWATQAYSYYYNDRYSAPLGSFLYLQDENKEHTAEYVYTEEEHVVISAFNDYYGEGDANNYLTMTGIKALYAGLLRNVEIVTYTLSNVDTGEIIPDENGREVREVYRANKSFANGGTAVPSQVLLEMHTAELGLAANGKYRLSFSFYFDYDDYARGKPTDDVFNMTFYIDYEAPVLVDTNLRFQDMKDSSGKINQRVYLDLDVFDNTYPQNVILCYSTTGEMNEASLRLATEYITPIINPKKNSVTTVSIDITDIYEDYRGNLFVELDDYALNHNVYVIDLNHSQTASCPSSFAIEQGAQIEIGKNEVQKLTLTNVGSLSLSNFLWSSDKTDVVKVKNGEIFGVSAGSAKVTVTGGDGKSQSITVTVKDNSSKLAAPTISFGTMLNKDEAPVKASGTVKVNPAQKISLSVCCDPWYYPIEELGGFEWTSSDSTVATVDESGNVVVVYEGERVKTVKITATSRANKSCVASVSLSVALPYTIDNGVLTAYKGWGGKTVRDITIGSVHYDSVNVLTIPTDKAINSIGDEAFKENKNVEVVIIPKAVTTIGERAFKDCVNLKAICFISLEKRTPADASLTRISRYAFAGCTSLTTVDLSNCKVFTIDKLTFTECTALKEVINLPAAGTIYDLAFAGCTSLTSVDLTGLRVAGGSVFAGCSSISEIITDKNSALGAGMFSGYADSTGRTTYCTSLTQLQLNCPVVPDGAFNGCNRLTQITLGCNISSVGAYAFASCGRLQSINFNGYRIAAIGDNAFRSCTRLNVSDIDLSGVQLGDDVFAGNNSLAASKVEGGKIVLAARTVTANPFTGGITAVGDYAFAGCTLSGVDGFDLTGIEIGRGAFADLAGLKSVVLPQGITEIPAEAFRGTDLTSITVPASVTKIGANAFSGCASLAQINFAQGGALQEIGASAFRGTAITSLALPDTVKILGDEAFAYCNGLASVTLPAVNKMGEGCFAFCYNLASAQFGARATTTGEYTFFTPAAQTLTPSGELASVTLGGGIREIGKGAFAYSAKLKEVDLNGATMVGSEAFFNCTALTTVTGLERVTAIGTDAFAYCTAIEEADLSSAETVGYNAFFFCTSLHTVTTGSALNEVGTNAFAESKLTSFSVPASCRAIGASAFSGVTSLGEITVAQGSKYFFSQAGVLYRYITPESFELVAYPAGRIAASAEGGLTYEVVEGTVSIAQYSFYAVGANRVNKIVLPHTVKLIGDGAFLACGATDYQFNSINAPTLLEGLTDRVIVNDFSTNSFFYGNFYMQIAYLVPHSPTTAAQTVSTLTMAHPTNGRGYDNYLYKHYFSSAKTTGEQPEDDTRTLKATLQEIFDYVGEDGISKWQGVKTREQVVAFADKVKAAHVLVNGLGTDLQTKFVGEENIQKLFKLEADLQPVKAAFSIPVKISSAALAQGSRHKSQYAEGERFSLEGLTLLITYDDYSQKEIAASGSFALQPRFDRELRSYDEAVTLDGTGEYKGLTVSVRVTVSAEEPDNPDNPQNPQPPEEQTPSGGCGSAAEGLLSVLPLVATSAAIAATAAARRKRVQGNLADGEKEGSDD